MATAWGLAMPTAPYGWDGLPPTLRFIRLAGLTRATGRGESQGVPGRPRQGWSPGVGTTFARIGAYEHDKKVRPEGNAYARPFGRKHGRRMVCCLISARSGTSDGDEKPHTDGWEASPAAACLREWREQNQAAGGLLQISTEDGR